ncbi:2-amino-4-hydroxy-6-hydroxymethyldihydropteridine pyrophosphokinase [Segniliparus rotundus DSM 44985]|uniref:2-amino-4-hydroxy-6-hydroxymethyldihydropteridine diphosphokinase n=1 Tax=Segniliparus rotundus (strain ATCC BAA-972 / CDC 1076 / CIP 108378 / DSM 44985 / JCM 13578) TaxID=640132 RepID=D6ZBT4_SEGRD|nr:2-amino-4-hydroxy-6-hydroxymethyldihydropteridine diphosphokinase [Segniliparus rotundus]ADG96911.1 2-amino-4-hydroxy-6-hydroxymethyldihydropteridine pyrophosphokinase [Segniliparus rotundus DSM 44985]
MTTAVLSLGSNLGNRLGFLQLAVASLGDRVLAASSVYETDPWGTAGPNFFNAVLMASDPALDARGWLDEAFRAEALAGRTRETVWGPRTLDVDVIACYDEDGAPVVVDEPTLSVPHPRAHQRAFVLVPWLQVQPQARLAVGGEDISVRELIAQLAQAERASVRHTPLTLSAFTAHVS